MSTQSRQILPLSAMGGCVLIFSVFAILVRIMENYFSDPQQLIVRLTLGGLMAAAICVLTRKNFSELWTIDKWKLGLFVVMTPLFLIFYTMAVTTTELLTAIVAFYSTGLITATILGRVAFGQKIHAIQIVAVGFAIIGLIVYGWPLGDSLGDAGFIFGAIAGALDAGNNATKRLVKGGADRMVLVVVSLLAGGIIVLIPELISGSEWKFFELDSTYTWHAVGWSILYSTLIVLVSYLMLYGFGHLSMTTASVILTAEIPLTALLAWWVYSETPSPQEIVGGGIVMLAVLFVSWEPKKESQLAVEKENKIVGDVL